MSVLHALFGIFVFVALAMCGAVVGIVTLF